MVAQPLKKRRAAKRTKVREIIGRTSWSATNDWGSRLALKSIDQTKTDYRYWDQFRRGKMAGFELSSMFADPICQTLASWVMGDSIGVHLASGDVTEDLETPGNIIPFNEARRAYTDKLLQRFMARIQGLLLSLLVDEYALGDMYLVVNPDGSLSMPSPDTVKCEHDLLDYRKVVKYTITTRLDAFTVMDEYRLDGRTVTFRWEKADDTHKVGHVETLEYANLIGRLPVVHFANDRGVNELYGRPIYEALLYLFAQYNDLLGKMLSGAKMMGIPIPVIQGVTDVDETVAATKEPTDEQYSDEWGNTRNRPRISYDEGSTVVLGPGATFLFASPSVGFTTDINQTLQTLFLLIMDKTRLPEVVWGNELGQARASSVEQMRTFYAYITGRRKAFEGEGADDLLGTEAQGGLLELLDIWLRTRTLTDPNVVVAPVTLHWSELNVADETLRQNWTLGLYDRSLITDETAVKQANLQGVEDPAAEVDAAAAQAADKQDVFDQAVNDALASNGLTNQANADQQAMDNQPPDQQLEGNAA